MKKKPETSFGTRLGGGRVTKSNFQELIPIFVVVAVVIAFFLVFLNIGPNFRVTDRRVQRYQYCLEEYKLTSIECLILTK